jgi:hypothetical protein
MSTDRPEFTDVIDIVRWYTKKGAKASSDLAAHPKCASKHEDCMNCIQSSLWEDEIEDIKSDMEFEFYHFQMEQHHTEFLGSTAEMSPANSRLSESIKETRAKYEQARIERSRLRSEIREAIIELSKKN